MQALGALGGQVGVVSLGGKKWLRGSSKGMNEGTEPGLGQSGTGALVVLFPAAGTCTSETTSGAFSHEVLALARDSSHPKKDSDDVSA